MGKDFRALSVDNNNSELGMRMNPETVQSFEGFIKGDLAESIVSRLFRKLGYHVKYNGIEVTHPDLLFFTQMNLIGKEKTLHLAYQPDFLIAKIKSQRYSEGLNLPVEVKYRKSGKISSRELLVTIQSAIRKFRRGITLRMRSYRLMGLPLWPYPSGNCVD